MHSPLEPKPLHDNDHEQSPENDLQPPSEATASPTPTSDTEKAEAPMEEIIIPDGGLRAWMSVLGGWIISFCTFGFASSFGVFEDYYVLSGASTSSNISWIGSIQLFLLFFMGLPAGKLFDEGYFHITTAIGSTILVFAMMMLSLADPTKYYQLLLAQGFAAGLGGGLILVPALSVQSHHWRKRRSLAMGIVFTGSSCGGLVYPIMLNQLFYHPSVGFHWGVRAAAFMTLGLVVIANFALTTRLPFARERRKRQADGAEAGPKPSVGAILRDPPFMVSCMGAFLGLWGVFLPYFYLQLFISVHGLSQTLAFYSIAIINAASVIGRTIPNAIADRVGNFTTLVPIWACTSALVFVMFAATNTGAVIVFAILYGAFSGAFISLLPPTLASMSRSPAEIGIRIGFGYCFVSFAMLTGTPIAGALLGSENRWDRAIIFSGVVMLAGSALLGVARHMLVRRKGTWRT